MIHNAYKVKPPTDRKILVQIIDDTAVCNLEWYEAYFDPSLDGDELDIYDDQDNYIGKVWYWKEVEYEN